MGDWVKDNVGNCCLNVKRVKIRIVRRQDVKENYKLDLIKCEI